MRTHRTHRSNRRGMIRLEQVAVGAVLVSGMLFGAVAIFDQVQPQLTDFSESVPNVSQGYGFSAISSLTASTAGSVYVDLSDNPRAPESVPPPDDGGDGGDGGDGNDGGDDGGDGDDGDDDDGDDPRTQGFWKNHPEDWPVDSLTLGQQSYSQQELLDILKTPTGGDASMILAHQLIAAKLNLAAGVDGSSISSVVSQADSILGGFQGRLPYAVSPSTSTGQAAVNASQALDAFNNGN